MSAGDEQKILLNEDGNGGQANGMGKERREKEEAGRESLGIKCLLYVRPAVDEDHGGSAQTMIDAHHAVSSVPKRRACLSPSSGQLPSYPPFGTEANRPWGRSRHET